MDEKVLAIIPADREAVDAKCLAALSRALPFPVAVVSQAESPWGKTPPPNLTWITVEPPTTASLRKKTSEKPMGPGALTKAGLAALFTRSPEPFQNEILVLASPSVSPQDIRNTALAAKQSVQSDSDGNDGQTGQDAQTGQNGQTGQNEHPRNDGQSGQDGQIRRQPVNPCRTVRPLTLGVRRPSVLRRMKGLLFLVASGRRLSDPEPPVFAFDASLLPLFLQAEGDGEDYKIHALFAAAEEKIPFAETPLSKTQAADSGLFALVRYCFTVFLSSRSLKYLFSSCAAFVIDYTLLLLLNRPLPMEIAAVCAWASSSLVNFVLNRSFVFRSGAPLPTSLAEYYSLAAPVFLIKTYGLLEVLARLLHLPVGIAKPIAEAVFFVFNYFVQKTFIFRRKKKEG